MIVERVANHWQLFTSSSNGIRQPIYDVVIPEAVNESEIVRYLADIFHESASEKYPDVEEL